MDPVTAPDDDLSFALNSVPASNDDTGLPMDTVPVSHEGSGTTMEPDLDELTSLPRSHLCVNCGVDTRRLMRITLSNVEVRSIIQQWNAPRQGYRVKQDSEEECDCEEEDSTTTCAPMKEWNYPGQHSWKKEYPDCGGKSQSPVDLPVAGLIKPRGGRRLLFQNNDVPAMSMTLVNNGKQIVLSGKWKNEQRPLIYGGAAHSRRYLFHSLTVHLPAEHTVGSFYYPLETQAYYVSAEYKDMDQALKTAASDPLAILGVASLYSFGNHTHKGLKEILDAVGKQGVRNGTMPSNCLNYFNPPFKEYACYQGSLTTPPCTEAVLWLIRGRTLYIERETWEKAKSVMTEHSESKQSNFRMTQQLNDRKVFYFKG